METKTVTQIDDNEFDDLIQEFFCKADNFSVVADYELNNDTIHSFGKVTKADFLELSSSDLRRLAEFIATGKYTYLSRVLVSFLVFIEVLPEGEIQVNCSW